MKYILAVLMILLSTNSFGLDVYSVCLDGKKYIIAVTNPYSGGISIIPAIGSSGGSGGIDCSWDKDEIKKDSPKLNKLY